MCYAQCNALAWVRSIGGGAGVGSEATNGGNAITTRVPGQPAWRERVEMLSEATNGGNKKSPSKKGLLKFLFGGFFCRGIVWFGTSVCFWRFGAGYVDLWLIGIA